MLGVFGIGLCRYDRCAVIGCADLARGCDGFAINLGHGGLLVHLSTAVRFERGRVVCDLGLLLIFGPEY